MVKQGARDDEVVGARFDGIVKDVDAADFQTRHLQVSDISDIDVARDHAARGTHAHSQSLRDRSVSAAEFQAAPTWAYAKLIEASKLKGIE
jgi:hypothetical protein